MTIRIDVKPNEESSVSFGFILTGVDGVTGAPNTVLWTLTDVDKVVVNSRENVSETPAAETFILLEGDDLAVPGDSAERILTIRGTYNATLGGVLKNNIAYTEELTFDIDKLTNIPPA